MRLVFNKKSKEKEQCRVDPDTGAEICCHVDGSGKEICETKPGYWSEGLLSRISNTARSRLARLMYEEKGAATIAFVIIFLGVTFIMIVFEIAFFALLLKMQYAGKHEIWFIQIVAVTAYIVTMFSALHSRFFRIAITFVASFLSTFLLGFLMWFRALTTLKVILGMFALLNIVGVVISLKSKGKKVSSIKKKALFLLVVLSFSTVSSASIMSLLPQTIEIDPDSNPELIFWCGSSQLPNDTDVLEMCKKYNIGFAPTIRSTTVGDNETMALYKKVIDHGIDLHFAIGGDESFFMYIDTAGEFADIYRSIRDWFKAEGIFDSPHVASFVVDAETAGEYVEIIEEQGPVDAVNSMTDNFPTKEEIAEAQEDLVEFTEAVREDGKEIGIIRGGRQFDEIDGDGDMSLITRNVYSLDAEWDYTVTMLYRTQRVEGQEEGTGETEVIFNEVIASFFGTMIEGTKHTTSDYSFYQNVALEQTPGDIKLTHPENQYIFVGNFKEEFEDTEYIKEKDYLRDIDICRHFEEEKIFLYELQGFLYHYGWEGVEELGKHCQQDEKWVMEYDADSALLVTLVFIAFVVVDILVFFEDDLN